MVFWFLGATVLCVFGLIVMLLNAEKEVLEQISELRNRVSDHVNRTTQFFNDQIDADIKTRVKIEGLREAVTNIEEVNSKLIKAQDSLNIKILRFLDDDFKDLEKGLEIITVRQRTLEKKIIEANVVKTIKVVVQKDLMKVPTTPKRTQRVRA